MADSQPPAPPSGRLPAWLARLRAPVPVGGGDRIGANVGAGAQNVTVGKNIIVIGTLALPIVPLLAILAVLVALLGFGIWRSRGPRLMPNPFDTNVMVAEFGQLDGRGGAHASADGANLSRWLAENLRSALADYQKVDPSTNVRVWHDGPDLGFHIGILSSEEQARTLAHNLHARVVIYGNLDPQQNPASFVPRFYVAQLEGVADEVTGSQDLGAAIPIRLPIDPGGGSGAWLTRSLRSRSNLLIQVTLGLAASLGGDHQGALRILQAAADPGQDAGTEAAVLAYLTGRELLFLDRDADAETYFEQALVADPTYARAHVGLGGVYHVRANRLAPEKRLDPPDDIDRAITEYTAALQAAPKAPGTQIELRARLGLATAQRLKAESFMVRNDFAQAQPLYDASIAAAQAALPLVDSQDNPLMALAYSYLGEAYHEKAHMALVEDDRATSRNLFLKARTAYDQCIQLAAPSPADDLRSKYCQPYRQDVQAALDSMGP